jgi:hypothetical protein
MIPIVRNIKTNDLYAYLGNDQYKNIRTGAAGTINPEAARDNLKINVEATMLLNEYPILKDLIQKLNLKME